MACNDAHLVDVDKMRIITCHVGNGGSITAVYHGKSIDTSMGLTPTEGLMMGTRVGDVDPGALTYLMKKHNLSVDELQKIINKESGVLGVSEISSDMREIEAADKAGDEKAQLALEMYEQRITKYIGAYAAEMGGVDIIVFTGGSERTRPAFAPTSALRSPSWAWNLTQTSMPRPAEPRP